MVSSEKLTDSRSPAAFGERVSRAFDTKKPAVIAKRLAITYQGARNYLDGKMPSIEKLVQISDSTGYSIHWLLTGEGPERLAERRRDESEPEEARGTQALIEELREAADVSRRLRLLFEDTTDLEIAQMLGVSIETVSEFWSGRLPATSVLATIADRTGVSLTWLLTNRGPRWAAPSERLGGETQGVSENNGSSQPRKEAVRPSPEKKGTDDPLLLAYVQLLVEQNNRIIQLLERVVDKVG